MRGRWFRFAAPVLCLALLPLLASAAVRLPSLISDNMCLQAGAKVKIWGWADPGEEIRVSMNHKWAETVAGEDGRWLVRLGPFKPGGPYTMTVKGDNEIVIKNVLVGEVWVASGQSNMQMAVASVRNAKQEIAAANYPKIRLFTVPRHPSLKPEEDVGGRWVECSPKTVPGFSAVAYFFGREIHKQLGVPVGLIHSSWGGTVAEAWTSREGLESKPELKPIVDRLEDVFAKAPDARERFYEYWREWSRKWWPWYRAMRQWRAAVAKAKKEGKEPPPKPKVEPPPPVGSNNTPTCLFYGMIYPLLNYRIRGVIWYQGESNAGRAYQYRVLFPTMIQDWRRHWKIGDFPFYYVQLANFMAPQKQPAEPSAWAELREAQLMALHVPNTGMAVIIDIGEAADIHPKNKQDVGKRLALWALAKTYGKDIVFSGPIYHWAEWIDPGHVRLHFKYTGSGLMAKGGELKGFAVAGPDRKFHWATAKIEGDTVVVWSDEVPYVVAVRYGWANNPICNLYNKEGLPASPFRTDDWPGVTINNK